MMEKITNKKNTILKCAEDLFAEKGFSKTTVADIAEKSGIHEASIYSYFNNKRSILFEINSEYLNNAVKSLNEHFQGMVESGPKIRKAIWHFLNDMKNNPNYARLLMMAVRENPEFYNSKYYVYLGEYVRILLTTIEDGQKEGIFRQDINPRLIRNLAMGTSVFTTFDSIVHNRTYDPHAHSDLIYQLVINAVGVETKVSKKKAGILTNNKRADSLKSRILAISTQVFASNGFSTATISEIAKRIGVGDATLYGYFESKEAILLAISDNYLKNLLGGDDIFLDDLPKTERELRSLIWRWIWQLWTERDFSRILVLDLFRNMDFYSSKGYQYLTAFLEKIQKTVQKGQKEGIFIKNIPFPTYLHMITGTIDQFLLAQFLRNRPPLGLTELKDIVDTLVRAIRKKDGTKTLE
jgi:AcrR family transcriptional regulator